MGGRRFVTEDRGHRGSRMPARRCIHSRVSPFVLLFLQFTKNTVVSRTKFNLLDLLCSSAFAFLVPGSQWPWDAVMATMLGSTTALAVLSAGTAALVLRGAQLAMMGVGVVALQILMYTERIEG